MVSQDYIIGFGFVVISSGVLLRAGVQQLVHITKNLSLIKLFLVHMYLFLQATIYPSQYETGYV